MLTLADLMTHHVDQLPLSARLGDAADIMLRGRISSVVVVEDSSVKGIVTERDIVKAMHAELPSETPVSDIMTSPVLTAPIGQDFRSAYQMAVSHQILHLVVVDAEGTPRGVVTETDIRRHLGLDFFRKLIKYLPLFNGLTLKGIGIGRHQHDDAGSEGQADRGTVGPVCYRRDSHLVILLRPKKDDVLSNYRKRLI